MFPSYLKTNATNSRCILQHVQLHVYIASIKLKKNCTFKKTPTVPQNAKKKKKTPPDIT